MRTVVYKASQVVQKHFMMVKKLQCAGLLHVMLNNLLGAFSLQKKETAAVKKEKTATNTTENETAINSQFIHAKTH